MRIEHDLLGEIKLNDEVYYGAQTVRAMELCNPSKEKLDDYQSLIAAMAQIKMAAAMTHKQLGTLDEQVADAIVTACQEVIDGGYSGQFPVDLFHGGGGVGIHMNVNEVIACRANEIVTGHKGSDTVHPNTHVNMGQSTNDVLPAAMKLAFIVEVEPVIATLEHFGSVMADKCQEFKDVVKVSRTCIQDAVPITLGQTLSANVTFARRQIENLHQLQDEARALPLGATAAGTGINTFAGYQTLVYEKLGMITGMEITQEENLFDGLQHTDFYVRASATLKGVAFGLSKLARDIRLLSSGPRGGIGEIAIESVQNGSSIMPAKVNPSLPELMNHVAYQVAGNDVAVSMACEGGELELNVWEAICIINLFQSCQLIDSCTRVFTERCIKSMTANEEVCSRNAANALALGAVVSAVLGYEKGTEVAKLASEENLTIKEAVLRLGYINEAEADKLIDPLMLCDVEKSGQLFMDILKR